MNILWYSVKILILKSMANCTLIYDVNQSERKNTTLYLWMFGLNICHGFNSLINTANGNDEIKSSTNISASTVLYFQSKIKKKSTYRLCSLKQRLCGVWIISSPCAYRIPNFNYWMWNVFVLLKFTILLHV